MCNCFEKIIESVKDEYKDKKELNVGWENSTLFFDGKDHAPTVLQVNIDYKRVKTNGDLYSKKTKKEVRCLLKFCPFCGERIEEA